MELKFITQPTIILDPTGRAPLSALLQADTNLPTTLTVAVVDGAKRRERPSGTKPTSVHSVPVLGLQFERSYVVEVTATAENGDSLSGDPVEIKTAPAPEGFPTLEKRICDINRREPGYIVFVLNQITAKKMAPHNGMLVAIDQAGDVVWTYTDPDGFGIGCVTDTPRGTLLMTSRGAVSEVNMMGNIVGHWSSISLLTNKPTTGGTPLDVGMVHHSTIELPNGNLLSIGTEMRLVEEFPTSETDPEAPTQSVEVKADVIVEFDRDGKIVNRHHLADIIDPTRISYYSVKTGEGQGTPGGDLDWSHSNGLFHVASDNSYLLSIRHQDAVVKIGHEDGELRWIIGDHTGWSEPWSEKLLTPQGDVKWQYHQHDPSVTPNGTIMCFDNGNCRAVPFNERTEAEDNYSRVVEYAVDEKAGTVEQVWEFAGADGEKIYTSSQGSGIWLNETGNVFCNFSAIRTTPDGKFSELNADTTRHARLIEVTHDAVPEPVFDVAVEGAPGSGLSYGSFRSLHIRDLYSASN